MAKVIVLFFAFGLAHAITQSAPPQALNDARLRYASTLQSTITQVASGMVQAALGSCPPLQSTWNASTDTDLGGFELLKPGMQEPLVGLFDSFAEQQSSFAKHVLTHVYHEKSPLDIGYARTMVHQCNGYADALKEAGAELVKALPASGFAESGGGFGFGLQVYCGCDLILTTGSGMGGGMTTSSMMVQGGLGGGGGLQMFSSADHDTPVINVGGGGGGDLNGCAGSTDYGQKLPVDSLQQARSSLMSSQLKECPPGALSVVGGGGGGMGFVVTGLSGNGTHGVSAYGGGVDLKFMNADAAANNVKCGGKLLEESNTGHSSNYTAAANQMGNYTAVTQVSSDCRKQCHDSITKGLEAFWKCTCPCTQKGFVALNLTFADKMKCA